MKNLKMSIAAMLLLTVSFSNAQEKETMNHNHSNMNMGGMSMNDTQMGLKFNDENIADAYGNYILIKTALVSSNRYEAEKGAALLVKSLKNIKGTDVAIKAAVSIENSQDLNAQRTTFSKLSNEMAVLVKGKLNSGSIYKDFCPMALDGGAYWLSSEKNILNPYYGDKMLKCGSVKEIIQ
jgi:hypothetical protein